MIRNLYLITLSALTLALISSASAQNSISNPVLDEYRPIDDQMMQDPPASDWLMWRSRYDLSGHSTLNLVNRDDVSELE